MTGSSLGPGTGLGISRLLKGLQLDGSFGLRHTEELEIIAVVDIDTSWLSIIRIILSSGVLLDLDPRSQWLPGSLRF